jgi:hypothetical protein
LLSKNQLVPATRSFSAVAAGLHARDDTRQSNQNRASQNQNKSNAAQALVRSDVFGLANGCKAPGAATDKPSGGSGAAPQKGNGAGYPVDDAQGAQFSPGSVDSELSFFANACAEGKDDALITKANDLGKRHEASRKKPTPKDITEALSVQVQRFTYGILRQIAQIRGTTDRDGGLGTWIASHLSSKNGVRGSVQYTQYLDVLLVMAGVRETLSADHDRLPQV